MSNLLSLKSLKVPADWRLVPIGAVLLDSQYGTNAPTIKSGGISIVGMKDIQDGKILMGNFTKTDLPESEKLKYLLKKGDRSGCGGHKICSGRPRWVSGRA